MQLVETHILNSKEIENLCIKARLLYNQSLYYLRQSLFGNIQRFSEYDLTGLFAEFNEETYRGLPAQSAQQTIKILFRDWKSYFGVVKKWKEDKSAFGKPKMPSYKKKASVVIFTGQQVKIKNGFIYFPINTISPIKTEVTKAKQVRLIPLANTFKVEIVYDKVVQDLKLKKGNVLSIDLGLNNLITAIDNVGNSPFIINGKELKSFNHWYNKKLAKLQSFIGNKGYSRRARKLTHYRNCFIEDKIHKASRFIIDYCVANNIGTVVIGLNEGWKHEMEMGRKNNQKFTEIPHSKLITKIVYKGELLGISVNTHEESYTSKCDALSLEEVQRHSSYLGRRVQRGLFQSGTKQLLNADVNGALNIGRKAKVFSDDFISSLRNSGCAFQPIRINSSKYFLKPKAA